MEILVSIQQYLDGNMPFEQAVELYNEVGSNSALKKMFATGEDDYSVSKLRSEFKTIADQLQPKEISPEETSFQSFSKPKNSEPLQIEKFPAALREAYHKLGPIIREMSSLHSKLLLYPTDAERFVAAGRIYSLKCERRIIWDRVDYFKEHGKDHPMYQVEEINPVPEVEKTKITLFEAKYKVGLLRSQRTKLFGKTHRLEDYTRVCNEIKELEDLIKNAV